MIASRKKGWSARVRISGLAGWDSNRPLLALYVDQVHPERECETMTTRLRAEVLETSSLFQLANSEALRTQQFAECQPAAVYDFVVHRSPIARRRILPPEHIPSDLNRKIGGAARI